MVVSPFDLVKIYFEFLATIFRGQLHKLLIRSLFRSGQKKEGSTPLTDQILKLFGGLCLNLQVTDFDLACCLVLRIYFILFPT